MPAYKKRNLLSKTKSTVYILFAAVFGFVLITISGCKTIEQIDTGAKEKSEKPLSIDTGLKKQELDDILKDVPKGYEGIWAVEMSCLNKVEYALLEIESSLWSGYNANLYVFERRQGINDHRPALLWRESTGTVLEMSGDTKKGGKEIQLDGEEWLLKSNRKEPMGLVGSLEDDGLTMTGQVVNGKSCATFVATKSLVSSSSNSDPIIPFMDKSLEREYCSNFVDMISNNQTESIKYNGRAIDLDMVLFDDEKTIRYLGKTLRQWTEDDGWSFFRFGQFCSKVLDSSNYSVMNGVVSRSIALVGKDARNQGGMHKRFTTKSVAPNLSWAGNMFIVSAARGAKKRGELEVHKSRALDSSDESIKKIERHIRNDGFPFNFMLDSDKRIYFDKLEQLVDNKKIINTRDWLSSFDYDTYTKDYDGYQSFVVGSKGIIDAINKMPISDNRYEMDSRYKEILKKHSFFAGQQILSEIPNVDLDLDGYARLKKYVYMAKSKKVINLHVTHQAETSHKLEDSLANFLTRLNSELDTLLVKKIYGGKEGIYELKGLSVTLTGVGLLQSIARGPESSKLTTIRSIISEKISDHAVLRQDKCDLLAAHPNDNQKAPFIKGIDDGAVEVNQAIDACIESHGNAPDNQRFKFQLGRALFIGQLYEDAFSFLEEAAKYGHLSATFYLAKYYAEGLGSVEYDIDKALGMIEHASDSNFSPAKDLLKQYSEILKQEKQQRKRQVANKLVIAGNGYELGFLMAPILIGEFDTINHGIGMRYAYGVLSKLHELGEGFCSKGVTQQDLANMYNIIREPHASGYIKTTTQKTGIRFLDNMQSILTRKDDNNRFENFDTKVLQDTATFMRKFGCSADEHNAFISNAKELVLAPNTPPYNLKSEPFWRNCMGNAKYTDRRMAKRCVCLLDKMNYSGVSRETAQELHTNFWPTLRSIIANPKNTKSNPRMCLEYLDN